MNSEQRYKRQISLPEIGDEGQQRLQKASVLCVGAGGLGSPALLYLAAAGIGRIGIIDFDHVDLSNLQRQILFTVNEIGSSKAELAKKNYYLLIQKLTLKSITNNLMRRMLRICSNLMISLSMEQIILKQNF